MSWKLRAAMSALLLAPQAAWALGLGEIRLNSALNEPLSAEIDLVAPTADELSALSAQLASRDLFQRYGLDRPAYLDSVSFSVGRGQDGRSVLLVSSASPIAEPFVTFLVEVNWPRGRLLREYTVLLDPPVFAAAPAAPPAPVAAPRAAQPSARPAAPVPAPRAPVEERPAAPAVSGGSYQVRSGDTLSAIARQAVGGDRAAVNQMMVALFRANPDAFAGNINVLKAGATLRVPGPEELQAIGSAEAASEIGRQMGAWRSGEVAATPARLRLVAPTEAPSEPLAPDASASEIQARIDSLSREIGDSQRLLELKNAELAQLQERLASERAAEAAAAAAPAAEAPSAEAPLAEGPVAEAPEAEAPAEVAGTAPAAAPEEQAPPRAEPEAAAPSFVDSLTDNWTYVLGAAVLLLGGGLAFGYARRRREQDLDEALRTFEPAGAAPVPSETARLRAIALGADSGDTAEIPMSSMETDESPLPKARAARPDDTISAEAPAEFDQADPLAEADFHMAYGLYDQAADIVRLAQSREPQRNDLKLKLLEIYFVSGNKSRFLEAAREFDKSRGKADAADWDRVVIMGRQIAPEHALFVAGAAGAAAGAAASVDLNLEGGESRVDLELLGPPVGDEDVDLDLGQALAGASASDETGENEALDFDLRDTEMPTAEMPRAEHTAEIPTVEIAGVDAPTVEATRIDLDDTSTLRAKIGRADDTALQPGTEATAEMAMDDLGLDLSDFGELPEIPEEDDVTMVAQVSEADLAAAAKTAELPQLEGDSTQGTTVVPALDEGMDFDLGDLEEPKPQAAKPDGNGQAGPVDLDVGAALDAGDREPTMTAQLGVDELPGMSELEPVTMSEVGTKLDLARAYVDMGDPDGARSILDEVLREGSASQRQEAQRLIDSLPGA